MANYDKKKAQRERIKQKEKKHSGQTLLMLAPLIVILAFIPLITFYYKYDTNLGDFDWFTAPDKIVDFFLYYKMVFILIASAAIVLILLYLFFIKGDALPWSKKLIPLAIYAGLAFLSALLSKYSWFSFHGIYEQFEPVWILLAYCLITYYAFLLLRTEQAVEKIMICFFIGILLTTILGLSQIFKCDFFRTSLGTKLITPSNYTGGDLEFTFAEGIPYLSLYNTNYVGYYSTLIIPLLAAILFASKKLWQRIVSGFFIAALLLILFTSESRAGFVAMIIMFLVIIICLRKLLIKNWKLATAIIAGTILIFVGINIANQNLLINRLKAMFDVPKTSHALKAIETNKDHVAIFYNDEELRFYVMQDATGNDTFTLLDGNDSPVSFAFDADPYYRIADERFPFLFNSIHAEEFNGFTVQIEGYNWYFTNSMKEGDPTYYALVSTNKYLKLKKEKEIAGFLAEHERLASGRGFIWSRTIPLLKKHFFLGSGPDTFVITFPHTDRVSMVNSGYASQLITKPHCLYLQIAVQTGIPSLIAFLAFFGWYIIDSFRLYWKNDFSTYLSKFGVAALASVIAYLVMGLTNDSCITVAPIFFVIAGMGLGINQVLEQQQKTPKKAEKKVD